MGLKLGVSIWFVFVCHMRLKWCAIWVSTVRDIILLQHTSSYIFSLSALCAKCLCCNGMWKTMSYLERTAGWANLSAVNIVSCDFAIIVWCWRYYHNNAACYRIVSEARKVKCLHAMWRVSLHDPTGWYSCSCLVAADVLYDELKFPLMQIVLFGPVDRFLGKTKKNMIYCIKSKRFVCKTALYLTQSQTTTARVSI